MIPSIDVYYITYVGIDTKMYKTDPFVLSTMTKMLEVFNLDFNTTNKFQFLEYESHLFAFAFVFVPSTYSTLFLCSMLICI